MADEKLGISASVTMLFAFPLPDGRWRKQAGGATFVDGHFHKITVPGIVTRCGESFGITATFHVIQNTAQDGTIERGDVARFVVENGRVMAIDVVASGVELIA